MKQLKCTRCDENMQYFTKEHIQLGKTGWILGDIPNLIAGALEVDIYICPSCRKLELFATENEIVEELPQRVCPSCGTSHDFDSPKCPKCKYDYYSN